VDSSQAVGSGGADGWGEQAQVRLTALFRQAGWQVEILEHRSPSRPDFVVSQGGTSYAVRVTSASEGRSDRLVPLWAQAYLQARRAAEESEIPLAVVAAPRIPVRVAEQVLQFAEEYAPKAAAGVIDFTGLRRFRGGSLDKLDANGSPRSRAMASVTREQTNIFSDLNQWLLKVLLAPELPESMLSAPRNRYRTASELGRAADVSVMTASRLVRQLQHDGYLDEAEDYLKLVRREDLFRRWRASSGRRSKEARFRFLMRGNPQAQLDRVLEGKRTCLALFAAAEALNYGFVHGVPPHVYVDRLSSASASGWRQLVPVDATEAPDVIIRQAPARNSVFRGAVEKNGVRVCDILQVWLDVPSHPTRGEEQAEYIREHVLSNLFANDSAT
jgi:hypothetical protein